MYVTEVQFICNEKMETNIKLQTSLYYPVASKRKLTF